MNHPTTDHLIDFLHGELAPAEDAAVHAHLATCAACAADADAERAVGDLLRASAAADEREMPSLVSAAVWQQIRDARPGPFARLAGVLRPAIAVPIAAALLVGGWFASPLSHAPTPSPHIAAAYYFAAHAAQSSQSPLATQAGLQSVEPGDGDATVAAEPAAGTPGYLGLAASAADAFDASR